MSYTAKPYTTPQRKRNVKDLHRAEAVLIDMAIRLRSGTDPLEDETTFQVIRRLAGESIALLNRHEQRQKGLLQ